MIDTERAIARARAAVRGCNAESVEGGDTFAFWRHDLEMRAEHHERAARDLREAAAALAEKPRSA